MYYFCCDERRRNAVAGRSDLNGIEFLEVLDEPDTSDAERQRVLFVHFINDPSGLALDATHVRIEGGERVRAIDVLEAAIGVDPRSGTAAPVLVVRVDQPGDFSTYTLRLLPDESAAASPLDPLLRAVDFSFKVNCPSDFDCADERPRSPEPRSEPALDYLARDYLSFRQLMLDRLAVLLPQWRERNPADLGIALVELLAHVGDQLSYRQDAVATEAYLGTCRLRTSARRHARLVDYHMHDGCNARAWVHVRLRPDSPPRTLDPGATLFGAVPDLPPRIVPGSNEHRRARESGAIVFQTLEPVPLFAAHNELRFHTWGARRCVLPRGATKATLRGRLPDLRAGMVLVMAEVRSPRSGDPDDAELRHRHAVRLTLVAAGEDRLGGRFVSNPAAGTLASSGTSVAGDGTAFTGELRVGEAIFAAGQERRVAAIGSDSALELDAPFDPPLPAGTPFAHEVLAVTDISWHADDALPFPLCVSAETDEAFGRAFVEDVSVALGNIVPADHGEPIEDEPLGLVPADALTLVDPAGADRCRPEAPRTVPARFRPALKEGPLTIAAPYDPDSPPPSARAVLRYSPRDALPVIALRSTRDDGSPELWAPRRDLLNSDGTATHFVAEVEAAGQARLRFGDGSRGARPPAGMRFAADYRVGGGSAGNIGAGALAHIVSGDDSIERIFNPLPAAGGVDLESVEEVRQYAGYAFRPRTLPGPEARVDGASLSRAVTAEDYAAVAEAQGEVQRAAASFRWTGSWRTAFVSVDRLGGGPVDAALETRLRDHLEPFRMAGVDLEVDGPRPVALEVTMRVRVRPGFSRSEVRRALLEVFSARTLPDGRRGVFHPDNFTFGQTVYLSPLYAAAQAVAGVDSVVITTFQRRDDPGGAALDAGKLSLARLEIARLDNDPSFPERGVFRLIMEGG